MTAHVTTLYGIKNCDTVKKARVWLAAHTVSYRFHDLRADGIEAARLKAWAKAVGWETLLNTRGTTWRQLHETDRCGINAAAALRLMLAHPTLIKRPVLEFDKSVTVGFDIATYDRLFPDA